MKKIGLYLDSIIQGGTFQYNLSILDAFLSFPDDEIQIVVAYSTDLWESYLHKENISAVKIKRSLFSRIWYRLRTPLWFWQNFSKYFDPFTKSFLKQNCDLWVFPSQDIYSYSLPIKSIGTVHDLMHRYEKRFLEAGSRKEFKSREKHYSRMCTYAEGILVDSELGKTQLIESYNVQSSKVHILPFVAPRYIFEYSNNKPSDYNLPDKYLFYPAQFWEHKNHKALVRAASLLKATLPNLKMVFVGSPNNGYETLLKLIDDLGLHDTFIFLDQVPDEHMRALYSNARALIMPTFFGPTNIPPLEAFATSCPVAVSNNYAMPEQVGDAGLLFDPSSDEEIAEIINKLWTDDNLVETLRRNGQKKHTEWRQEKFNQRLLEIMIKTFDKN